MTHSQTTLLFDKWAQKKCTMLQYRYLYPLTPHVPCKNMERKNCSKEFLNWSDPPPPSTSFQSTYCESSPWPVPLLWTYLILSKNFKSQNSARISNPKTQQEFRIPKLSKNFESQNTPTKESLQLFAFNQQILQNVLPRL